VRFVFVCASAAASAAAARARTSEGNARVAPRMIPTSTLRSYYVVDAPRTLRTLCAPSTALTTSSSSVGFAAALRLVGSAQVPCLACIPRSCALAVHRALHCGMVLSGFVVCISLVLCRFISALVRRISATSATTSRDTCRACRLATSCPSALRPPSVPWCRLLCLLIFADGVGCFACSSLLMVFVTSVSSACCALPYVIPLPNHSPCFPCDASPQSFSMFPL
jgi:hypothetical protein